MLYIAKTKLYIAAHGYGITCISQEIACVQISIIPLSLWTAIVDDTNSETIFYLPIALVT